MHQHSEKKEILESIASSIEGVESSGDTGSRIFVTGKGGVGKTLITALLAYLFARDGYRVLAVDADPQQNLAYMLGVPPARAEEIVPIAECADYIEEKTGARPGAGYGGMLRLNPDARDVVDRFGFDLGPITLLVMGSVRQASSGCMCPENALLHAVLHALELREEEIVLMDTQGGLEHFGRALTNGFDQGVIVTEPTYNAVSIARRCMLLSMELGVRHLHLVMNKVRGRTGGMALEQLSKESRYCDSIITLPFDDRIAFGEEGVTSLLGREGDLTDGLNRLQLAIRHAALEHR